MSMMSGVEAARSLRDLTAQEAQRCEEQRTLTEEMVGALWACGLMTWANPAEADGSEPTFAEMIETWIEMAWQDGSLGWIGIANIPSAAAAAAYLPAAGFAEVFTSRENRSTVGGQFFPNGLGEAVDGGYRLTGAWNFGSGTGHAEYVAAGFIPTADGEMELGSDGIPPLLVAATYATEASREVVEWAHLAGGTSAIREGSRLERAFRDMYTGTQHVFIGEKTYTDAARITLGLIDDQLGL